MGELRCVVCAIEKRETEGRVVLTGRPIVYNSWSERIGGYFKERILPGAFDEYLATEPDIIACRDHNPALLLGRTSSKTLRLRPDDDGIGVEIDPPETTYARDLIASVSRGDIRGMSFVFDCLSDAWSKDEGTPSRDVRKAKIYEVSYVTFPAYSATDASTALRSLARFQNDRLRRQLRIREVE